MNQQNLTDIINKAKSGNTSAFSELYEQTQNQIYFFALTLLRNKESAEDVMQETFITVFDKIDTLKDPAAYKSWVNQIALNKIRRLSNKKQEILVDDGEESKFENVEEESELYLPENALDSAETRKMIMDLIDHLTDVQKTVVLMYYYEQMTVSQIAEAMQCSEGTIKSRLNYARKEIKAGVKEHEKKGIKLYSLGGVPMLLSLLDLLAKEHALSPTKAKALLDSILGARQAAACTSNEVAPNRASTSSIQSSGEGVNAQQTSALVKGSNAIKMVTGKIAAASLTAKIVAGTVAAAVVLSGAGTIYHFTQKDDSPKKSMAATISSSSEAESQTISVQSVSIDKTMLTMDIGKTEQLTATVLPDGATDKSVTWSSSDTGIATVDATGLVTSMKNGTCTVTAASSGVTAACNVTVNAPPVSKPAESSSATHKSNSNAGTQDNTDKSSTDKPNTDKPSTDKTNTTQNDASDNHQTTQVRQANPPFDTSLMQKLIDEEGPTPRAVNYAWGQGHPLTATNLNYNATSGGKGMLDFGGSKETITGKDQVTITSVKILDRNSYAQIGMANFVANYDENTQKFSITKTQ